MGGNWLIFCQIREPFLWVLCGMDALLAMWVCGFGYWSWFVCKLCADLWLGRERGLPVSSVLWRQLGVHKSHWCLRIRTHEKMLPKVCDPVVGTSNSTYILGRWIRSEVLQFVSNCELCTLQIVISSFGRWQSYHKSKVKEFSSSWRDGWYRTS